MILITGATGRTGSALIETLAAQGETIRARVRDQESVKKVRQPGVEVVVGNYEQPATLELALRGVERVFLLSPEGPQMSELQADFVDAAKRAGVRRLVRQSILVAMMPDSPLALAQWHSQSDRLVEESGVPYTILRPAYFMQNVLASASAIASNGTLYGAMGEGKVGMIDTRDVARVAAAALTGAAHEGQTYVLTGPESVSMRDIARKLSGVLGREVTYADMSPSDAKAGMVRMGTPEVVADAWVQVARMVSTGAADMVTPMVEQVTGIPPRPFEQFAGDYAGAFNVGTAALSSQDR
ncbi:MAG: SDR family oxidoreductase [Dehalococcoidia bacterium]